MTTAVPHADFNMRVKAGGYCLRKALTKQASIRHVKIRFLQTLKPGPEDAGAFRSVLATEQRQWIELRA
jgi:hypothetical protein